MSSREPFFEPIPPDPEDVENALTFTNQPWAPPLNVLPARLPFDRDVVATDTVVIRLAEVRVYDRGFVVEIDSWVHPGAAPRPGRPHWLHDGPRVGVLLGDGTKLGFGFADDRSDFPPSAGTPEHPLFHGCGGTSHDIRCNQSYWISPAPVGSAELVVAWPALEVGETFAPLDLDRIRAAQGDARVLWPLPDAPEFEGGWFAYPGS